MSVLHLLRCSGPLSGWTKEHFTERTAQLAQWERFVFLFLAILCEVFFEDRHLSLNRDVDKAGSQAGSVFAHESQPRESETRLVLSVFPSTLKECWLPRLEMPL